MYIFKEFLKIKLRRLCSLSLIERCVSIKKFSTTCFVSQALRVNPDIIEGVNTETGYFRHYIATDPSFADIYLNESILKENAKSTNKLVVFLRNMAQNTVPARDGFNGVKPSFYRACNTASYTVLDFIEIFYFITYFDFILGTLNCRVLSRILSRHFQLIEYKSHRRTLTLFLLIAHDRSIYIPLEWMSRLVNNLSSLTKSELVAAFYVLSQRKHQIENNSELAELLMTRLKEMTANEMAIIALGCFKNRLRLGAGVGQILLNFLIENIEHLNCIPIGAISKCARFMHDKYEWAKVNELHKKAFSASDRFTITTLIHLAKLKADRNFFPSKYLDVLSGRMMGETRPRIKDIERFLMIKVRTSSDLLDPDFLNFVEEIVSKSKEDCINHWRAFVSLIHYLIILNIFKEDWIDLIFSSRYLTKIYNFVEQFGINELGSIDCSLELERPSYKGNRLPPSLRRELLERNYAERFSGLTNPSTSEVHNLLIDIFGAENVSFRNVLPHLPYRYSLMCFGNGREPIRILTAERDALVKWMRRTGEKGEVFVPNLPKFQSDSWLVFVVKSDEVMTEGGNLNLMIQFKVRQLKALGLNPVMVDSNELKKFEAVKEKKNYVVNIVNEAVKSINNARGTCSRGS